MGTGSDGSPTTLTLTCTLKSSGVYVALGSIRLPAISKNVPGNGSQEETLSPL